MAQSLDPKVVQGYLNHIASINNSSDKINADSSFIDGFINAYGSAEELPTATQNEHSQRFQKPSIQNASQSATGVHRKQRLTFKRNRNP